MYTYTQETPREKWVTCPGDLKFKFKWILIGKEEEGWGLLGESKWFGGKLHGFLDLTDGRHDRLWQSVSGCGMDVLSLLL